MFKQAVRRAIGILIGTLCLCEAPSAIEMTAGDWKFSASGNVNVHYIASSCEEDTTPAMTGGLACRGVAGEDRTSSISNGLLPAALAISVSTTQKGYDLGVTFGFYPGISTNDGSPNLQQGADLKNTALGTTGIDMRQVFMTFGNDSMGTFLLGRNIGLFGADAILGDMTLPGVGAGGGNYATPANTSLGSIGFGYIYTDWLAQINYTTPDFGGFKITVGVFDPLEPIVQDVAVPESSPGIHGKVAFESGAIYLSATVITQKHTGATPVQDFDSLGFDIGGKVKFGGAEFLAYYYQGEGMGTTALYNLSDDRLGNERDSDGFLVQFTYKFGDTKLGVNYGVSNLDLAAGEPASPPPPAAPLVKTNEKYTVGAYHSLTENLTLLAEFTDTKSEAHDGTENDASNFNIGAYLSF
jgi:predicted porin